MLILCNKHKGRAYIPSKSQKLLSFVEMQSPRCGGGGGGGGVLRIIQVYFSQKNVCCDPSSEPSRRENSNDGSQHTLINWDNKDLAICVDPGQTAPNKSFSFCYLVQVK